MKLKSIIYALGGIAFLSACTDLSEDLYDRVGSGDYGKTASEIETIVGRAYSSLRGGASDGVNFYPTSEHVFFTPEVASNECVIPVRLPDDWLDKGVWLEVQRHQWSTDNTRIWALWKYAYNGIASTNSIIYQVEQSGLDEEASKPLFAELKSLRAYYYYKLLDWFGNVPIETSFIVETAPETSPRADVFAFVEKELTENIAYLPTEGYGRFTRNAANMLLARLYLNAEVFTGKERWSDCLTACSKISGQLEADYFKSFLTENQVSREIIFSIPYDHTMGTVGNFLSSMTFHYEHKWTVSATGDYQWCGNGISAEPGVYSSFEDADIRRKSLLIGDQIDLRTGATIIMPASGNPLTYTEEISNVEGSLQNEGARLHKYEVKEGEAWERDHDWVVMRYAEALMMQAECNVRLGNAGAARPFIDQIRSRAGLDTPEVIDLDFIEKELGREFIFEDHRRTDNIRFGTYYEESWAKPADAADKHTGLFPIPAQEIAKNSKLKQNPGYN
uniref:Putative RagB-SusD domain-containing protein n=1 Tax=termite gut metagenome TaxID=433724 RepID=S0DGP0_9ZZZZ